jgi:hypothetical protein
MICLASLNLVQQVVWIKGSSNFLFPHDIFILVLPPFQIRMHISFFIKVKSYKL